MVRKMSQWGVLILAVMALLGTPSTSDAAFRMRIEDNAGNGVVLTDTTNSGVLFFSGAIGGFSVNITTGTAQPPLTLNTAAYNVIDINSINVHGAGPGTLRIILERDGFTEAPTGPLTLNAALGGTSSANNTVLFQGYANGANNIIGLGTDQAVGAIGANPTGSIPAAGSVAVFSGAGYLSSTNTGFSVNASTGFNNTGAATYSLAAILTLNFTGAGATSGNYSLYTTPEPATIVAALGSLPILGVWARRRKIASVTAAV